MPNVLTDGKVKAGAYMFPGMKEPHICYDDGETNTIYDCGQFNSRESAERFMNVLAKIVGADNAEIH